MKPDSLINKMGNIGKILLYSLILARLLYSSYMALASINWENTVKKCSYSTPDFDVRHSMEDSNERHKINLLHFFLSGSTLEAVSGWVFGRNKAPWAIRLKSSLTAIPLLVVGWFFPSSRRTWAVMFVEGLEGNLL